MCIDEKCSTVISLVVPSIQNVKNHSHHPLKGVGVADFGFCYADSRQTGSGNDSKTFEA